MHGPAITHSLDMVEDFGKLGPEKNLGRRIVVVAGGYPLRFDRLRLRSTAPLPDPSVSKS